MSIQNLVHRLNNPSLFRLAILAGLVCAVLVIPAATAVGQVQDPPPVPLPRLCGVVTPPGHEPPPCCMFGYVYYQDKAVTGASVRIDGPSGVLTATTAVGISSADPHYGVDLSSAPLLVSVGDTITLTAVYSDMLSARTWTVQSNGQQVDVGLIAGYHSPAPVHIP
ncbi:MAG: hypothetical protein JW850_21080 [Thermoflexales bacterium]|nr:hypothetical protein [Thermoflexales bacterium]